MALVAFASEVKATPCIQTYNLKVAQTYKHTYVYIVNSHTYILLYIVRSSSHGIALSIQRGATLGNIGNLPYIYKIPYDFRGLCKYVGLFYVHY